MHRRLAAFVVLLLAWIGAAAPAEAHLMVQQHGTVNVTDDGTFVVLSLPASLFDEADDNADGTLSRAEFRAHYADLAVRVDASIRLEADGDPLVLRGTLLNLEPQHAQIVVMGRFDPGPTGATLRLAIDLMDSARSEAILKVRARRGDDVQLLLFDADHPQHALFGSGWSVFVGHVGSGLRHILGGPDHLLFLLVVLAAGWSLRRVALALTCFTVGHAVTLFAVASGLVATSPAIVEPAIAASIIAFAVSEWIVRRGGANDGGFGRMALIFGCALVHGLGLASALGSPGPGKWRQLHAIAGFNLGIELGQLLAVAVGASALWWLHRRWGPPADRWARSAIFVFAIVVASAWFFERLAGITPGLPS